MTKQFLSWDKNEKEVKGRIYCICYQKYVNRKIWVAWFENTFPQVAWVRGRDGHILTVGKETFVADRRISSLYSAAGIFHDDHH